MECPSSEQKRESPKIEVELHLMPSLIFNEELPPDLREALEEDARNRGFTVNDAANRILSEHYEVEWESSGFPYREIASRFKMRVPTALHQKIRMDAASRLVTIRGIVLSILADHYHVTAIDPGRRPRKEVA